MNNSKGEKKKRPDRLLYIAPALRSSSSEDCEDDNMQYPKDYYASGVANGQDSFLENCNNTQTRSAIIVRRKVLSDYSSSSFNSRIVSDKSCKDDDSSDFEESSSASNELKDDQEVMGIMGTNENRSNHWNGGAGKTRKDNREIKTTLKSLANMLLNSESNETKTDRGLFSNFDDDLSDIETFDCNLTKGRVLTSTPNSDIVDQNVIDAAKFDPEEEESGVESTLLDQSDIRETTIDTIKNKCGYNFEIYHDPSVSSQSTDFSEICGNNYIPPPHPPSISRLPPIHRLPSPVPYPHVCSVFRHVSSQKKPQLHSGHPRIRCPPSLQSFSLRIPSPIPPPHSPKERFNPSHAPEGAGSLYLNPRQPNSQSLASGKVDDSFYIPPPVPPPQLIRNVRPQENVQSRQPKSIPVVHKIIYDEKMAK